MGVAKAGKVSFVLIILILVLLLMPFPALAASRFQAAGLSIEVIDFPKELAYVDILVPKNLPEVHIDHINQKYAAQYPAIEKGLKGLDSDGYVSYTLYFTEAYPDPMLQQEQKPRYFAMGQLHLIKMVKIAIISDQGEILKISDVYSIQPNILHQGLSIGASITYHYQTNTIDVEFPGSSPYWALFDMLIIAIPTGIASFVLKLLMSLLFQIKPVTVVIVVNLVTQGLIAIATPFLAILVPFWVSFAMLELFAIVIEYTILAKKAFQPTKIKLWAYLLAANAVTAILNACVFGGIYGYFRL